MNQTPQQLAQRLFDLIIESDEFEEAHDVSTIMQLVARLASAYAMCTGDHDCPCIDCS